MGFDFLFLDSRHPAPFGAGMAHTTIVSNYRFCAVSKEINKRCVIYFVIAVGVGVTALRTTRSERTASVPYASN